MVFGNMGDTSATGVAFTRNPATGEKVFFGEYLVNAQGEDVVAGIRTPQQISNAGKAAQHSDLPSMEESMPQMYKELNDVRENSKNIIKTCKILNSPFKKENYIFYNAEMVKEQPKPL